MNNHIESFNVLFDRAQSDGTVRPGILTHIVNSLPTFEIDDERVYSDRPVWRCMCFFFGLFIIF